MFPAWTILGLSGVALAVGGTLFDKYLLTRYFDDAEDSGPGALVIFSAYFSIVIITGLLVVGWTQLLFQPTALMIAVLAGVLNGVWIYLYLQAISDTDVSQAAPLLQTIPAFGLLLGFFWLGETLNVGQLLAMSILIFGALVLLYERTNTRRFDSRTLLLMLGAAFLVALSQAMYKVASFDSNFITATTSLWIGFLLFGVGLHVGVQKYRKEFTYLFKDRIKSVLGLNSVNEVFDSLGELFMFAAVLLGPIALVQTLNVYEPAFIFICSLILTILFPAYFKEDVSRSMLIQKTVGITIVLCGSLLLYQAL